MLIWDFLEKESPGGPGMRAERLVRAGGRRPVLGIRELSGSEEEKEPESQALLIRKAVARVIQWYIPFSKDGNSGE